MRTLILGGTAWLGRHVAEAALDQGHEVVCLARGASGDVPEGVGFVRADRDHPTAYDGVAGQHWDLVVDVARQPGQVRRAVTALEGSSDRYVFVSSGNAYAEHRDIGRDETSALMPPLDGDVMEDMESYGPAKVACEQHVLTTFGAERSIIARAGLIGGPGDHSDRSGYWPLRFRHPSRDDGSVLVPDALTERTQLIDVRDLASWLVTAGTDKVAGVFNAAGEILSLEEHLRTAQEVAGHRGEPVLVEPAWLRARGVEPWMGEKSLPLWIDDPDWAGFSALDTSRARAAGLATRPLRDTLEDTLRWELSRDLGRSSRRAGLSDPDERSLLDEWLGSAVR